MSARCMLSSGVCPSARLSVTNRHSIETTGRIQLGFFYHEGCIVREFGYIHGYFPLELWPKLRTYKISPRQVNRVVNKTRRRWSLLTTADAPWLFIALIVRMATTLLKGEESTRDNHLLAGNFATDFEFFY